MRILFLDDQPIRHGYFAAQHCGVAIFHAMTAYDAVAALCHAAEAGLRFTEAHLDHDLSDYSPSGGYGALPAPTGLDVATFISLMPAGGRPVRVVVHSWNPDGARRMVAVLRAADAAVEGRPFQVPEELLAGVGNFALEQQHTRQEPQGEKP